MYTGSVTSTQQTKKNVDKPDPLWYYIFAVGRPRYARVVELADSLDSGSSVHYARAGSSPASRTNNPDIPRRDARVFYARDLVNHTYNETV